MSDEAERARDGRPSVALDEAGPAAPPRRNGELLFAAPWESRAFGLAVSLHRAGLFAWDEFRRELIAEIAAWERAHPDAAASDTGDYRYYLCWLAALERLLDAKGIAPRAELAARTRALAARPHGHDHDHRGSGPARAPRSSGDVRR